MVQASGESGLRGLSFICCGAAIHAQAFTSIIKGENCGPPWGASMNPSFHHSLWRCRVYHNLCPHVLTRALKSSICHYKQAAWKLLDLMESQATNMCWSQSFFLFERLNVHFQYDCALMGLVEFCLFSLKYQLWNRDAAVQMRWNRAKGMDWAQIEWNAYCCCFCHWQRQWLYGSWFPPRNLITIRDNLGGILKGKNSAVSEINVFNVFRWMFSGSSTETGCFPLCHRSLSLLFAGFEVSLCPHDLHRLSKKHTEILPSEK